MPRSSEARAATQSSGTAASAAWVGVEQATAATSSIRVESRSCPTALITGTRSIATVRQSVSSQKAQRSARLPPPRVTTIASTCGCAARPWIAVAIAGAAWRSCTGAKAQTTVPRQPRRSNPASRSRRAAPVSAVTTPIVFGSSGRASCRCSSNRPSAWSCLRSASNRASRSPSPASRSCVTRKENPGEEAWLPMK